MSKSSKLPLHLKPEASRLERLASARFALVPVIAGWMGGGVGTILAIADENLIQGVACVALFLVSHKAVKAHDSAGRTCDEANYELVRRFHAAHAIIQRVAPELPEDRFWTLTPALLARYDRLTLLLHRARSLRVQAMERAGVDDHYGSMPPQWCLERATPAQIALVDDLLTEASEIDVACESLTLEVELLATALVELVASQPRLERLIDSGEGDGIKELLMITHEQRELVAVLNERYPVSGLELTRRV